jgi:hypothetical protein
MSEAHFFWDACLRAFSPDVPGYDNVLMWCGKGAGSEECEFGVDVLVVASQEWRRK